MTLLTFSPPTALDDAELIQRCLRGEKAMFKHLVDRYSTRIYQLVFSMVQHTHTAEDITQDIFIKVYQQLHRYNLKQPFFPWVTTIAKNTAKSHLRKRPLPLLNNPNEDNSEIENIASTNLVEETLYDSQAQERLLIGIQALKPEIQQALLLKHSAEWTCEEIAKALNTNVNTIKTWLKRGREKLISHYNGETDS